mmetsp:Transcript_20827/g.64570  ORF Transcript_20827/g.64570 Transcript_20827/m.64570 type:complete len:96 (+) Transcript_20827:101-388(+)
MRSLKRKAEKFWVSELQPSRDATLESLDIKVGGQIGPSGRHGNATREPTKERQDTNRPWRLDCQTGVVESGRVVRRVFVQKHKTTKAHHRNDDWR